MAEPLVFLPGMMCDARLFGPQIAALSSEFSVMVSPVTRGERIEEIASGLLDELPQRFALAGLSMGGIVAMELLRRAPDRITRLALMDTNPLAETPQVAAAREPQIVKVRAGRMFDVMREEMKPNYLAPGPFRNEILDLVMDMAEALGPDVFIRQSRALQRRRDQQGTLRKCKVPTMVLCGAHDALCPVKRHTFMAELIHGAELRVLEHAGHLPTLEMPDETTQAIRDWMRQPLVLR
ncbi:alpha/beta fold hydrolase [uncultured Tateyamaria sp.]|uniref:alpha/beta fold hydrolase n=1 Tax=uncultured Tateyamaria sp. TaxID=455651 RepID=UPI002604F91F|nr:alpha/beta fold hydrolase [uncultured Tateyamaria sp.]